MKKVYTACLLIFCSIAVAGCKQTVVNGLVDPYIEVHYQVAGSDSFSLIEISYVVPMVDTMAYASDLDGFWTMSLWGYDGDSVGISVQGYNPSVMPGTLEVKITTERGELDSPNNPDSCITHKYAGHDTCLVSVYGILKKDP